MYTYKGGWKGGLKHGKGEIKYADGTRIEATWDQGRINGEGTYYAAKGAGVKAVWHMDIMVPLAA
jgi:hypothetical protein